MYHTITLSAGEENCGRYASSAVFYYLPKTKRHSILPVRPKLGSAFIKDYYLEPEPEPLVSHPKLSKRLRYPHPYQLSRRGIEDLQFKTPVRLAFLKKHKTITPAKHVAARWRARARFRAAPPRPYRPPPQAGDSPYRILTRRAVGHHSAAVDSPLPVVDNWRLSVDYPRRVLRYSPPPSPSTSSCSSFSSLAPGDSKSIHSGNSWPNPEPDFQPVLFAPIHLLSRSTSLSLYGDSEASFFSPETTPEFELASFRSLSCVSIPSILSVLSQHTTESSSNPLSCDGQRGRHSYPPPIPTTLFPLTPSWSSFESLSDDAVHAQITDEENIVYEPRVPYDVFEGYVEWTTKAKALLERMQRLEQESAAEDSAAGFVRQRGDSRWDEWRRRPTQVDDRDEEVPYNGMLGVETEAGFGLPGEDGVLDDDEEGGWDEVASEDEELEEGEDANVQVDDEDEAEAEHDVHFLLRTSVKAAPTRRQPNPSPNTRAQATINSLIHHGGWIPPHLR